MRGHRFDLQGLGIALPTLQDGHPNRQAFEGTLTRVNEASTRPPHGAKGHRVLIPSAVAEAALPSLIGMAVDVSEALDDHTRQKIGIITEAWIDGKDLRVRGFLYAKDFPVEVEELRQKRDRLGMSYEITQVAVEDESAPIWTLTELIFTGAAILERKSAAYERTSLYARGARSVEMRKTLMSELAKLNERVAGTIAAMQEEDEEDKAGAEAEAGGAKSDEDATFPPKKEEEDEEKAGTAAEAGKMAEDEEAEHDDEEEDLKLLKKVLTRMDKRQAAKAVAAGGGAVASPTPLMARRMDRIEAAMELLTDSMTQIGELITDLVESNRGLQTDKAKSGPNGGKMSARQGKEMSGDGERPKRKTLAASDNHQFLSKYGLEAGKQYTTVAIDEALRLNGVSDPTTRIGIKHFLEANGQLAAV